MLKRLLSYALWLANADPPPCAREQFYALKQRLLERHGRLVGHDLQHIVKECWTCDGTGLYRHRDGNDVASCRRCDNGVYQEFWVRLERWELAGRIFHRPVERRFINPCEPVTIKGRIEHEWLGRRHAEAGLWLALLFDRRLFWRMLVSSAACGWTWCPLVNVQKVAMRTRLRWDALVRRCFRCKRRQLRWRTRSVHLYCKRCERVPVEVPF